MEIRLLRFAISYCLILSLFLAFPLSTHAKVARIELSKLIQQSNYIVLARVESITEMDGVKIARAVPLQAFKGANNLTAFYFVAEPTWTCDTSQAKQDETALFFLNQSRGQIIKRRLLRKPDARVTVQPLFFIAHSGRGKMPLRVVNGAHYVVAPPGDVVLPRRMKRVPGILLSDLVAEIPKQRSFMSTK